MVAMVPSRPIRLKPVRDALRARFEALSDLTRPLAWAWALWFVVVALPYLWLYPGERLSRPICMALVFFPPLACLFVASSGQTRTLLATGLGGLVPPLVACPELLADRVTGAVQGLAVAGLLVSFIASTVDAERQEPAAGERLRAVLRPGGDWLVPALGAVWLALAWFGGDDRTPRVAVVATAWMAVHLVPLGASPLLQPTPTWWLQRGGIVAALLAVWGWWA